VSDEGKPTPVPGIPPGTGESPGTIIPGADAPSPPAAPPAPKKPRKRRPPFVL